MLADRSPFSKFAIEIFDLAEKKKSGFLLLLILMPLCITCWKKHISQKELRKLLHTLLEFIELIAIDTDIIKKSLLSNHKDFEDAIQIFAANSFPNMDFIVTRNLKDFKNVGFIVMLPDQLIPLL